MAHAERAARATQLRSLAGDAAERSGPGAGALADHRPQAAAQRAAIAAVAASPAAVAQRQAFDGLAGGAAQLRAAGTLQAAAPEEEALQMQGPEEELLQGAGLEEEEPLQGAGMEEDELQMKPAGPEAAAGGAAANRTGLPDGLKSGVESLSGMSLDGVRVHYNSDRPAQMNALAFAQGGEIHLGAGQEKHLPHEAWHVVQQAQGRVAETRQMRGVGVNDDPALEQEADQMGARAMSAGAAQAMAAGAPETER